jgi:signal transduction histidine kinase/tetratricopeptide (TPR) repeat protein
MLLAQLIHWKTAGNPFFVIQFIHALVEEGLVSFEYGEARWRWDLDAIHAKGYTDNVVDLMVNKLNRLPATAQTALQQLACIGNSAESAVLSAVLETSGQGTETALWDALQLELIVRSEDSYRFAHDRVREATYSLMAEEARAEAHLRIGRLLHAHTPPEKREEAIFEIVNQLNRGAELIVSEEERFQVTELNLIAGKRAKGSTAYASALQYFVAGQALLTDEAWERDHDLIFQLALQRAECEFLTGELTVAAERLEILRSRATDTVELAMATCLGIDVYMTLGQMDRAIATGLDYLRHVAIDWPVHPTEEQVKTEYQRIWSQLAGREIEEVIDFPLMSDPASIATLDVLTKMVPPALFTDRNLFALVSCRGSSLSIERGSSDGSCLIYVWFSDIAGHRFGDYQDAFRFAQLGYELVEKRGLKRFQASTYVSFAGMIMPWMKRLADCRNVQERAFEIANGNGDLTYAVYARVGLITQLTVAGEPLHAVQSEAEKGLDFARKAKFAFGIDTINRVLGFIRTLRGSTTHFGSFDHAGFDEKAFDRHLDHHPPMNQFWHWVRKLQVHFLVGDFASAIEASLKARPLLWASPTFEIADYELYSALSRAALWDSASSDQRREHLEALSGHYQRLATWAESCPENFQDRATLVAAEIARIEGRSLAAIELYEQSIRSARGNGFVHNEALAHEVAAQFYAARGFETFADAYLRNARNCYDRWGAQGKVKQLDERYPRLREGRTPAPSSTISAPFGQLDVEAVVRASQAISSEMVLPRLIEKLLRIAVEHAGAERGLLILIRGGDRGGEPRIEAEAITGPGKVEVVVRHAAVRPSDLLQSALHYVIRTRERVLLDDASSDELYSKDDYVRRKHSRSVLCLPIIKQTKLVGALYLENALTPSAFTPDRVTVLQLLASQAAISLENVGLFSDLRQAQDDLARVHRVTTMGELAASLAHELSQPISGAMTNANTCLRKLGRDDPDLDEVRTATRRIVRDAQRATDIIGRIRSQFKKGALNQEVVDVNEINRETVALLRDEAGRYNISVHTELAIDLPQMVGDRVQLQQVSMNLIVNSIEAMKDKDGIREIIIKSQRDEDEWILVSVSDSGVGFPQQLAEQIFDPFFTTKPRGTGMGLRICRSIIESHRGRLWAVGTPGRGATFYLRLPAAPRVPQSLTNSRL